MEALASLGQFFLTVVVGLLVLTVLVYVHELGHYLFARMFGMRVNAFAIFMGGVRKTDLAPYLDKKLVSARWVWLAFALSFGAAAVGAVSQNGVLYLAGLGLAGIVVPVWAMVRLSALYHVPVTQVLGTWLKALAVGVVVLALGTKFKGIDPAMVVGVFSSATLIALALAYYLPINMREPEDDKQGFGQVNVVCKDDGTVDQLPVRYRPIWSRQGKDGTEYSLLLLPLGGFAQIAGMHAKADGSESQIEGGFYSKPPWQRLLVLFAGPLFSIAFGFVVLFALYSVAGKYVPDTRPIVGGVGAGSGAEAAGIEVGDVITEIDGHKVEDFYGLTLLVRDKWVENEPGKYEPVPISVTFNRGDKTQTVTIVPKVDEEPQPLRDSNMEILQERAIQARLGVMFDMKHVWVSPFEASRDAIGAPIAMVKGLAGLFTRPSTAKDSVAGPATMASVASAAVNSGVYYVVSLAGLLSISLGVMNLLPIVPLDGGQMVVAFVELLRGGKRLSLNVQNWLANSGIGLLVLLMLAVSAVDLGRSAKANQAQENPAQPAAPNPKP